MRKILIILFALITSAPALAAVPVGGGSIPGWAQAPDTDGEIIGIRLNPGWGYHKKVYGFDIGLVGNTTSSEFIGVSVATAFITNLGKAVVIGAQFSGLYNYSGGNTHIAGMQATFGMNHSKGKTNVYGIQLGALANSGNNNVYGLQMGLYNEASSIRGFQIGLINKTKSLSGIQIGLANFAGDGLFSFFPIINIGF